MGNGNLRIPKKVLIESVFRAFGKKGLCGNSMAQRLMAASLLTSALRLFRSTLHRLRLLTASLPDHDIRCFDEG